MTTFTPFKTGRGTALRPLALKDLTIYATGVLQSPPSTFKVPDTEYPIDCNDTIGDCTIAGTDHLVRAWRVLFGDFGKLPTEPEIKNEYFKLTGGPDTGLVEATVLRTWAGPGLDLYGGKIHSYCPVNPQNILGIHQTVAFYGGCYLGINVGEPQQEDFRNGKPWTWVDGQEEDGHCVVALGYTQTGLLCATWGGIAELTYGFLAHALEESWCVLSYQLVEAKKDTLGLDLVALEADMANIQRGS